MTEPEVTKKLPEMTETILCFFTGPAGATRRRCRNRSSDRARDSTPTSPASTTSTTASTAAATTTTTTAPPTHHYD